VTKVSFGNDFGSCAGVDDGVGVGPGEGEGGGWVQAFSINPITTTSIMQHNNTFFTIPPY